MRPLSTPCAPDAFRQGEPAGDPAGDPLLAGSAERQARERASVAESVLDNLTEVVFQTDAAGVWTFLNPAWEELTGIAVAQALGRPALAFVYPADRELSESLFQPLIERRKAFCRHQIRYEYADATFRWVEVYARLVLDADGGVAGTAGTLRDVTESKAAEEKLRLAASVFMHAGEGIMIAAADGTIIDVNAAFEHITGYTRAEAKGRNPRMLSSGRQSKDFYAGMWQRLASEDFWQGEVWNRHKSGALYVERLTVTTIRGSGGEVLNYVGLFADVTTQKLQAQHLEHIAHYDPLTALPNRRLLADRLQQSMALSRRNGTRVAVAYIDLDGFKTINDGHGHECGDELLVIIGKRMSQVVRACDMLGRLGGDEFVAVFDAVRHPDECLPMIARLLGAVAEPVIIDGKALRVTGSLGLSLSPLDEEIDAEQLMRQADQAMYQAKEAGKNRFCVFDEARHRLRLDQKEGIDAIERALERGEFVLHYQPIVSLLTGELNSVEALIRWQHPERGLLAPAHFLPLVEGHPVSYPLENWVLEEALGQHERWLEQGWDIAVSVNMSSTQLHQRDFVERLGGKLAARPNVKPGRIKLEVLETSALADIEHVSRTIAACAQLGVAFALDDFGTGYSSLLYLKQLPARYVKIDQGFVRDMLHDPDDLAILEGVMGMAAAFKREVIAEGVESVEQARMLVQLGCTMGQGYGIARPMPAHAVPDWASQWRLPAPLRDCRALERERVRLLVAVVEHRAWSAALLAHLADPGLPCPELRSQSCRLGQWFDELHVKQTRQDPPLAAETYRLHEEVHALAQQIAEQAGSGEGSHLAALVVRFESTRDALLASLQAMVERDSLWQPGGLVS